MPSDRPKKPHGTFTPAATISGVLTRAGYAPAIVRKGEALGGHRCSWDRHWKRVLVGHQCPDSTPDSEMDAERTEMLSLYADVLTGKGYHVERNDRSLYVNPIKEASMPAPKPTTQEQIAAVALLRTYAGSVPGYVNPTAGELAVAKAIDILDNADLFAALDRERDEWEATQEDRTP